MPTVCVLTLMIEAIEYLSFCFSFFPNDRTSYDEVLSYDVYEVLTFSPPMGDG